MALYQMKLPELGEGIHEGEIVKWHIKPGDQVEEDQIIADVQNDKSVVELPSPVSGKIVEIKVAEGTVCTVEDVILVFEVEGAGNAEEERVECAVGGGVAANVAAATIETPMAAGAVSVAAPATTNRKVMATPSVRKLAREKGIFLVEVTGTGRNGRITREDVLNFVSGGAQPAVEAAAPAQEATPAVEAKVSAPSAPTVTVTTGDRVEERVPLKGIRKVIANAMVKSKQTAPHVTLMDEVDVTELVALRSKANKAFAEKKGLKLTYLPFIAKALVAACRQYPELNASIDDEKNEIVYKKYYNVGIATDTDNGLIVPVVTDADRKSIWSIAGEIKDLAARGREGKLASHELKGSTITITNIGSAGGMFFTPVINHPEVAILGTGRITEKPVVKDGQIVAAPVMALSLSFDHRLIDGATAQNFLNYIKQLLADPQLLVMEV
ncbi:dihydrolipoamide acetyltransferase family protein [Ammoniphilus sp. CFH 90114]|uniref:dihydrolipoamide acetyltransferase family protein n=1 Tax=Ammoniphilus sp. CFH 90114 TaxID=2493665 RepID=UPI00100DB8BC|nr:dihydrolipoamide acetyltransferase family protein [Ammoniphilus sp. CFH 90114]RXT07847.1 2-oxo acid dehydrogenase subunit E2 [Ammoniphilus sp. CFH 90114]